MPCIFLTKSMTILLLGHNGYLGSYLYSHLEGCTFVPDTVENCDFIINCAAKSSLEFCEQNPSDSYQSNYGVLYSMSNRFPNAALINFSSYYVYDDSGFCNETANINDTYSYTRHKILSERWTSNKKGVTFRLGKLFGHNALNRQAKLTEFIINEDKITVDRVKFNPTSLRQVCEVVQKQLDGLGLRGVYNLSNKGHSSHYEYAKYINNFFGTDKKLTVVDKLPREFQNYGKFLMDTSKISEQVTLTPWQKDLETYLGEIKCTA